MNLGRKMLIIGAIMFSISYAPLPILYFGMFSPFMIETPEGSGTISLIPSWAVPFVQIFTYGGFSLLIAGGTYRFWRRK